MQDRTEAEKKTKWQVQAGESDKECAMTLHREIMIYIGKSCKLSSNPGHTVGKGDA